MTHNIVEAIIGFDLMVLSVQAIYWHQVVNIIINWNVTPLIAGP